MRGAKPKPDYLKVLAGNPGRRPLNDQAPQPTGDLKRCPSWLSKDQKKIYRAAIKSAPDGLLKELDLSVFLTWVVASDLHRKATEALETGTMLEKTPHGMRVQSPYIQIIKQQSLLMIRAAAEMGFTPSSRSRVRVDSAKKEDDSEEFFAKRPSNRVRA